MIVRLQGEQNELAWTEFVSAYEPFLLRLIERQGVPSRHVPDAAQQVLTAIAQNVTGWRIATLTRTGVIAGTPQYISTDESPFPT